MVVLKLAPYGADPSVPIAVQVAAPAGLRENVTEVASPVVDALSEIVPATGEPGLFSVTPGAVASTSTVIGALVKLLPARSVTTMRRS